MSVLAYGWLKLLIYIIIIRGHFTAPARKDSCTMRNVDSAIRALSVLDLAIEKGRRTYRFG